MLNRKCIMAAGFGVLVAMCGHSAARGWEAWALIIAFAIAVEYASTWTSTEKETGQ
jgi:hypothetical protein